MIPHVSAAALAKAKAFGIVAAALTAGSVGGVAVLSQVQGPAHLATSSADSGVQASPDASVSPSPTDALDEQTSSPTAEPTDSGAAVSPVAVASTATDVTPTPTSTATNHGQCVSAAAHDGTQSGADGHGSAVRAVATSDCGRSPHPHTSHSPDAPDLPDPTTPSTTDGSGDHGQTAPPDAHGGDHGSGGSGTGGQDNPGGHGH